MLLLQYNHNNRLVKLHTSLNKTFNNNVFRNWTGGSAAVTAMFITAGASTISTDTISNITTATNARSPYNSHQLGALESISITNNFMSNLVTEAPHLLIHLQASPMLQATIVTITGHHYRMYSRGYISFRIYRDYNSGRKRHTDHFGQQHYFRNQCRNRRFHSYQQCSCFATVNINSNIVRNSSVTTGTFTL